MLHQLMKLIKCLLVDGNTYVNIDIKPTVTIFFREVEGSMFHLNVSTCLPDYTVSHPKEPQDAYSGP